MRLTARPLLWTVILLPILTFCVTYPIAYTQPRIGGVDGQPICSRPLRYVINYLSDSIDYTPSQNVGTFGISLTVVVATLVGIARFEQIRREIHQAEQVTRGDAAVTPLHQDGHARMDEEDAHSMPMAVIHAHSDAHGVVEHVSAAASSSHARLLHHLSRLNTASLYIGAVGLLGALGVAAVQEHASSNIHSVCAILFFGGIWIYECVSTHLTRKLEKLRAPSWRTAWADASLRVRVQMVLAVLTAVMLLALVGLILTFSAGDYTSSSDTPSNARAGIQTAAALEIAVFLALLTYLTTWDASFKRLAVEIDVHVLKPDELSNEAAMRAHVRREEEAAAAAAAGANNEHEVGVVPVYMSHESRPAALTLNPALALARPQPPPALPRYDRHNVAHSTAPNAPARTVDVFLQDAPGAIV